MLTDSSGRSGSTKLDLPRNSICAQNSTIAKKIRIQFGMEMKKRGPLKTDNPLNLIRTVNTFYSSVGKITADKAMHLAKEHGLL